MTTEIDADGLSWPERLTLRDTKVYADEGQRIFTTATGHGYARQEYVRADLATSRTSEAEPVVQCCMCGKTGLSTVEGDGGPECQLSDGRWTSSQDCWEHAVDPTPTSDDQVEAVTDEMVERAALALAKRNHVPQWREFIPDARAALLAAMGSTKR